jgi:integrase
VARPIQDVRIWEIQDRRRRVNATMPWVVRWKVDGAERSRAFRTKAEADHVRSQLLVAARTGEQFDRPTGEPASWQTGSNDRRTDSWAREWLAEQWPEWQPRTRSSAIEALARFVPLVRRSNAPHPPEDLRTYLTRALSPDADVDPEHRCEKWLRRWCLPLGELDRELMARVERQLVTSLKGQPLSASVASRYRKVAHACLRRAVDLGIIDVDPWPPAPKGRSRRKAARQRRAVDVRVLPNPVTMAATIEAIRTYQRGSRTYQLMTAVAYYAGLRPSEVVMLRPRALHLPGSGWGRIDVMEADIDWDESGEPKSGERSVPIPPRLVAMLRTWIDEFRPDKDDLIFRTRNDRRPTPSNWSRALKRALSTVGHRPLRVYDCRHAAATTWLQAGVPLGEVARRLGHSVETLVSTYVGALQGDEQVANERIEAIIEAGRRALQETSGAKDRAKRPKLNARPSQNAFHER